MKVKGAESESKRCSVKVKGQKVKVRGAESESKRCRK